MKQEAWSTLTPHEVILRLKSDRHKGLSSDEVQKRKIEFGPNVIAQRKKTNPLLIVLAQFKSAMIYILLIAAGISFALGHITDASVILAAVVINVIVGFIQEFRAERALAALQKIVTITATVIREGAESSIPLEDVVPGDIVKLQAGSKVPADIRLLGVSAFTVNEAALTGESVPIDKHAEILKSAVVITEKKNMAFLGTMSIAGSAVGIVVATGKSTELGGIATMIAETPREQTPLQQKLKVFSRTLAIAVLVLSFILFAVGIFLDYALVEMFTTAVAIAVAAIPEGLVVVMTVILALGMERILKRRALVRKLVAAETLGSTNVICTDKTGTLTQGDMHVVQVLTFEHNINVHAPSTEKHPDAIFRVLRHALLASDAYLENPKDAMHEWRIFGTPTERAIVGAAAKIGILREQEQRQMERIAVVPFSSEKKYMLTLHKGIGANILFYKGAPELLLRSCQQVDQDGTVKPLVTSERQRLQREYQTLSSKGFRALGVGYARFDLAQKKIPENILTSGQLIFEGFLCLQDPLRSDAAATIAETKTAGIRTVMLTGDHHLTAQAIAKEIGLPAETKNVIEGTELERLSQQQLDDRITTLDVYARVSPKDKLRIIDAWQRKGAVVAMTGDGVNDAPALKSADIGLALGSGTDVAKETADIILLENNFSVIVHAIEEGRIIYANIKKVILYLIADSFTEMILISFAIIGGLPLPLLASQILWVNLVSDGLPALALTMEAKEADVMRDKPIPRNTPIFDSAMKKTILVISLFTGIGSLALFAGTLHFTGDLERARTITFLAVSLDSLLYAFSVRTLRRPIWKQSLFANPWLMYAVIAAFIIQLVGIYTPFFSKILHTSRPHPEDWLVVGLFALLGTSLLELMKGSFRKGKKISL